MARKIASFALILGIAGLVGISPAQAAQVGVYARMTGAAEAPSPGDPDATGLAVITIDTATGGVCLSLQFANVTGTLSGLHIHQAPPGVAGPIVVNFSVPASSPFNQCVVSSVDLATAIATTPGNYYINLHATPSYPGGAIRGQLQTDSAAATCQFNIVNANPRRIDFTVQDVGSGLATIQITTAVNIVEPVFLPTFTSGTTSQQFFSVVKDNQALRAQVAIVLTDSLGNRSSCV